MGEFDDLRVAAYRGASASTAELTQTLSEAWRETLADADERARVAAILQIDTAKLNTLTEPPLRVKLASAGIDPAMVVTTVVTWIVSDVLLGDVTDLAKGVVRERLSKVWKLLEPRLRRLLKPRDGLGTPIAGDTDP